MNIPIIDRELIFQEMLAAYGGKRHEFGMPSGEVMNHLYESDRSHRMRFMFLNTKALNKVMERIQHSLAEVHGSWSKIDWLAINVYEIGAVMLAHKDRDIGYGEIKNIAVTTLRNSYEGGAFYLCPEAECSEDGKMVYTMSQVLRHDLVAGEWLVFENQVHGVEEVNSGFRMSISVRDYV